MTTSPQGAETAQVQHLRGRAALDQLGSAFDELAQRSRAPLTARRPWLQTWIDCYGDRWTPWFVTLRRGSSLVAAAPLAYRRRGPLHDVRSLGFGRSDDVRLPALDDACARQLAHALSAELAGCRPWRLHLDQLPVDDPVLHELAGLLPGSTVTPGDGMPTIRVTERDPHQYLSRNTRKAVAKARNRLADAGVEPAFRWTRDHDEIAAVLPEVSAVHRARDAAMGRRSDHDDPAAARFYSQVTLSHAERGEVELLTLRLDGSLASYVLAFRDGRVLRSWDNRLSPQWAHLSAGRLANTEAIMHVVTSTDHDELDWMRGEEPYKLQSATHIVPTSQLRAWSSRWVLRGDEYVDRVRHLKRSSPAIDRLWAARRLRR